MTSPGRTTGQASPARWRAVGWAVLLVFASFAIVIGRSTKNQNADSLIPIFVSLESWTLFYWGQDRFGMLTALLALPFRNSFANLVAQNFFSVVLLLGGMAATCARAGAARAVLFGLVFGATLLSLEMGWIVTFLLTTNQSYGPALGCFGLAVYCCGRKSWGWSAAALILMVIGAWTNAGVALFMVTLATSLLIIRETRHISIPLAIGAVLSVGAHPFLQRLAPAADRLSPFVMPTTHSAPLIGAFWAGVYDMLGATCVVTLVLMWAASLWLAHRVGQLTLVARGLAALAVASLLYGSAMALFLQGSPRHLMAAFPLWVAAPIVVLACWSSRSATFASGWRSRVFGAAPVLVMLWLLALTGLRSPEAARRELAANLGGGQHVTLYTRRVDAVTGDYWQVWPLVFATNLLHERENGRRPVLPVAFRCGPLLSRIAALRSPNRRVAIIPRDDLRTWEALNLPRLELLTDFGGYEIATTVR
jgi:hypothetical protein